VVFLIAATHHIELVTKDKDLDCNVAATEIADDGPPDQPVKIAHWVDDRPVRGVASAISNSGRRSGNRAWVMDFWRERSPQSVVVGLSQHSYSATRITHILIKSQRESNEGRPLCRSISISIVVSMV
jgi:hypothetical protein